MKRKAIIYLTLFLILLINGCSLERLNYEKSNVFLFSDTLNEEEFSEFVGNKKNLMKINNFINEIDKNTTIEYHYSQLHPVGVEQRPQNDHFFYLYDEGFGLHEEIKDGATFYNVNSIQTDSHAVELNGLVFLEGHSNNFESQNLSSSVIPVVLGYNYNEFYKLNDTFNIDYLSHVYEVRVIGFLERNQTMITSNEPDVNLDNYIVLPKINVSNSDIQNDMSDNYDKNLPYISKVISQTHAILITNKNEAELSKALKKIGNDVGFTKYTTFDLTNLIQN